LLPGLASAQKYKASTKLLEAGVFVHWKASSSSKGSQQTTCFLSRGVHIRYVNKNKIFFSVFSWSMRPTAKFMTSET
jgi:hypothetical protein